MKKSALFCLLGLALASTAFATTWNQENAYWVNYEFSATAFGKAVSGVYAHTGVLHGAEGCGFPISPGPGDWEGVQHVELTRQGDHYFGKARLNAHTGECQASIVGPVVEYWVYFADGSPMMVTDMAPIPTTDTQTVVSESDGMDWDKSVQANDALLSAVTDASSTSATQLVHSWAD